MISHLRSPGLRQRLVALALLVLIPLALLQAAAISMRLRESIQAEQAHSKELANAVAASFMHYVDRLWATQVGLGHRILLQEGRPDDRSTEQTLRDHLSLSPAIIGMVWLGPDGARVASTLPDSSPLLAELWPCFERIAAGADRLISDVIILPDGSAAVIAAAGIRVNGRLEGVALAGIDTNRLGAELLLARGGQASYLLIDRSANVVYHSQHPLLAVEHRRLAPDSPVLQALQGQPVAFERATVRPDIKERLGAAVPVPEVGWVAVASNAQADALAAAYWSAWVQVLFLIVIFIISLAGALYLGGRILRPILALTDAASMIATGNLQARVGAVASLDELSAAVNTFNLMASRVEALEEERERFYTLSAGLLGTITPDGRFERFNPEWERTLGYSKAELFALSTFDLLHPDDEDAVARALAALYESNAPTEVECRLRCRDGSFKWFYWSATPFPARNVIYLVGQDITVQKRADAERNELLRREQLARASAEDGQRRLAFLAEASNMLAMSIDYETTLGSVVNLAVPHLADWCSVSISKQEGDLDLIAMAHRDPALAEWGAAQPTQPDPVASLTWAAIRSGKPILVPEVDLPLLQRVSPSTQHLEFLRRMGVCSAMIVPMVVRGQTIGVLSFCFGDSGRRYTQADLSLAEELALRAALAIENARLYRQAQASATRAEETLALLDTLLACAPVGIAFLDPSLHYVKVNGALASRNGIPTEGHIGRTVAEVAPAVAADVEPIFHRVMQSGEPVVAWEGRSAYDAQTGHPRHWLESIYPVRTGDGKVLGIGVMVTDITERKRMEEALRTSELLLSGQNHVLEMIATGKPLPEILEAIVHFVEQQTPECRCAIRLVDPTGGLKLDPSMGPDFEPVWDTPILAANGETLGMAILYAKAVQPPGTQEQNLLEIFARLAGIAIERQNAEEARNRKLESLIDHTVEGVIGVDEDGRLIVVNAAARKLLHLPAFGGTPAMADAGLPAALVEILHKASRSESQAPARYTLVHGNAELDVHVSPVVAGLGRHFGAIALLQDVTAVAQLRRLQESFVANVSHELRAPLASLSAMAEAINDGVASEAVRGRYLKAILSEAERLRRLTNDILELSRLDSGVAEIAREEFDLDLVLESTEETWDLRASAAGIHLAVERRSYRVLADYDRVLQVLTNLVDNAVKFTPRGGSVRVWAEPAGEHLRVSVSDTGPGIRAEHLPYVWQRFYMVDQARTRTPGSGTGLGLAIAHHLVENMGGQVGVESAPNQGSVFWFTLPLA